MTYIHKVLFLEVLLLNEHNLCFLFESMHQCLIYNKIQCFVIQIVLNTNCESSVILSVIFMVQLLRI
jgi:hypothetical protein